MNEITSCTMDCPDSCSLIVSKDLDGETLVRGNPDHPFTRGFNLREGKEIPQTAAKPPSHHPPPSFAPTETDGGSNGPRPSVSVPKESRVAGGGPHPFYGKSKNRGYLQGFDIPGHWVFKVFPQRVKKEMLAAGALESLKRSGA